MGFYYRTTEFKEIVRKQGSEIHFGLYESLESLKKNLLSKNLRRQGREILGKYMFYFQSKAEEISEKGKIVF